MRAFHRVGGLLLACGSTAVAFLLTTVLMDRVPDAVIVGAPLAACALVVLASARLRRSTVIAWGVPELLAAAGGALSLWAAPLLALFQRATDAPSGSETIFFTTAAWALVTCVAGLAVVRRWSQFASLSGAIGACTGAAILLASWERPSSFSPFVRYFGREMWMLAAGALFAVGALLLARSVARIGARRASEIALLAAGGVGVVAAAIPALTRWPALVAGIGELGLLAVAWWLFARSWVGLIDEAGTSASAAALLLVPSAVTALAVVERATGSYGPSPIAWPAACAGIALSIVGSLVTWRAGTPDDAADITPQGTSVARMRLSRAVIVLGLAAVASALAGLALPTLDATVDAAGIVGRESYHVAWVMVGAETAAGWVTLSAALLAFATAIAGARDGRVRSVAPTGIAALACVAAFPWVRAVPLHTWTGWIPAEVQQVYGTDMARFTVSPNSQVILFVTLAVATACVIGVIASLAGRSRVADSKGTAQ